MNRLQELRKNKGDTQKTLAELLGVSEMTISRWEKEPELKIKYEYIQKLAEYFKVNIGYLLGYDKTIQNEALGSYQNMARLLRTNPDLKNIISEYDETNRKNGKWDLSLSRN